MSEHAVRVETRTVDLGTVADLPGRQHTAVTVFTPDPLPDELVVAFGFPGGGYNRRYFDLPVALDGELAAELPGPGGSSEARWHAARGWCFVACDHLGVGDSSRPDP
ncbi:MAG TPA: hypothetical protein VEP49_19915, partial [Acidimicrobiia bacterium]|nr:hypothetical protein [Acidimicrobiia bacterium]